MRHQTLTGTDLKVSQICLGTMTFGQQNSAEEAFQQLDLAMQSGINFIDTAEMYSIPARAETYGKTEEIIGQWLHKTACRQELILASKVVGRSEWLPHIRNSTACLDRKNIRLAVEKSLQRLQTDYLDLYQVHWPDRSTNFFGQLGYQPKADDEAISIEQTLSALAELVKEGKIRYIGVSNETPWGLMQYLRLSEQLNLPRVVSIQNPYNLLNRSFEVGLAEMSLREHVGLLAYSPMAFGVLSGKYIDAHPANARLNLFPSYQRYTNENGIAATKEYASIAAQHELSPAQMALAFVNSRAFLCATIIGATTLGQLKENIASINIELSENVLQMIDSVQQRFPNPCP